jgi:hypothetical protein
MSLPKGGASSACERFTLSEGFAFVVHLKTELRWGCMNPWRKVMVERMCDGEIGLKRKDVREVLFCWSTPLTLFHVFVEYEDVCFVFEKIEEEILLHACEVSTL